MTELFDPAWLDHAPDLSFSHPAVLGLLAVPAGLLTAVWLGRGAGRRVTLPLDRAAGSSGRLLPTVLSCAESLPPLVLACVVCLLAGPQTAGVPKAGRSLTNVMFAVDVSGSMGMPFGEGTRCDAAMASLCEFVDKRPGTASGLFFWAGAQVCWVPLTTDPSAFKCARDLVKPARFVGGGTAAVPALRRCRERLLEREDTEDRLIIVISDGDTSDLGTQGEALAKELLADKVTVFAVEIGMQLHPELQGLCRLTGGEGFQAGDPEALAAIFAHIDKMKPAKVTPAVPTRVGWDRPFALAGLALAGLYALTLLGLRYTPW